METIDSSAVMCALVRMFAETKQQHRRKVQMVRRRKLKKRIESPKDPKPNEIDKAMDDAIERDKT